MRLAIRKNTAYYTPIGVYRGIYPNNFEPVCVIKAQFEPVCVIHSFMFHSAGTE